MKKITVSTSVKYDVIIGRGILSQAGELSLGFDLFGHQVEQKNAQRTDILCRGARFGHDENVFVIEYLDGGKIVRNFNGHNI